ncbi:hypothetical protein R1sor_009718 [Riccia sorocarpa]|uniref:Anthranilate phosphoribosyltransferase n=1 Tax=Riccia sorocarpa TaxID=122646 RepID=A0ABD3HVW9_9MARC
MASARIGLETCFSPELLVGKKWNAGNKVGRVSFRCSSTIRPERCSLWSSAVRRIGSITSPCWLAGKNVNFWGRKGQWARRAAEARSVEVGDTRGSGVPAAKKIVSKIYPEPNKVVLEALGRVCTGPLQTKPLNEEGAFLVLETILNSVKGELPEDDYPVSAAQMGAFFGAMTLRSNSFPAPTQWSEGEKKAMNELWPSLLQHLPEDVLFLADPEGTIFGEVNSKGPRFQGRGPAEMRLVGALREVLMGGHLGFEEVLGLLKDILPLKRYDPANDAVSHALVAAFFIVQRMNKETDRELKAYCMAFDEELGPPPIANVKSLTHYGEPYDGNTRFFRNTLFVAAVRASYGECCLLHGIDSMPPKLGVTEEQMLKHLGAATNLMPKQAVKLLEDERVGFAYLSQREARPSLYSLIDLRKHIRKRPTIATTEKVQHYIRATGREAMMAGFYHEGYEDPLLMLIRRRSVDAGIVIKGEEGALSLTTKTRSPDAVVKGRPVNWCTGFRPAKGALIAENDDGLSRETFSAEINAVDYGFEPTPTPRIDRSVEKNVELGMAALRGETGPAYDRIVLNAAIADHLLGCEGASDPLVAIERAKEAIDSGAALNHLLYYIERSNRLV